MGIVLKILSVLGIILLSIIGLVLLILLIVLLSPINYRARVVAKNGDIETNVKVGWMFFIRFLLDFKDKNLDYRLKLFGIKVFPKKDKPANKQETEEKLATVEASDETVKSVVEESKPEISNGSEKDSNVTVSGQTVQVSKEQSVSSEKTMQASENVSETSEKVMQTSEEEGDSSIEHEKKSIWVKLDELVAKLKAVWEICVAEKIEIETFFKRKSTKYTLEVLKKAIFNILNHIRPRKLNGRVEFGFDDPATTGYALAALGAFYGLYCDNLEVTPDFSGKTIDADVTVSGRIVLGYLVFIALSVYIRKKVRMFIKNVMALKDVSLENVDKIKEQFAKASAEA